MRLFIGLDIEDAIRQRIARFMEGVREFAPGARWVRPESLHLTLKFIGEKPSQAVANIKRLLAGIDAQSFELGFRGYGFFPSPKSARVFWVGIDSGPQLAALAGSVDEAMQRLGIAKEDHAFSPHLTLARGGGGSGSPRRQAYDRPNLNFQRLHEKLAGLPVPEFGTMTAREFFLYQSQLSSGGSRYSKLERFALR
jgi:RNA 2',3'-cyclic 3'-phosphodiesterase